MQHDEKLEKFLSRGNCLSIKRQQEKIFLREIIKTDQKQNNFTRISIYQAQVLPKLHLPIIKINWNQYDSLARVTTSILWRIPMITLTLLMHMKNTSEKIMNNRKYLMMWMRTQFMKNNYSTFIKILSITSHHQQLNQVFWMYTKTTQTFPFTTQNIFAIIADDSYVNTRAPIYKQIQPRLEIQNCIEYKTTMCSPTSLYSLTS